MRKQFKVMAMILVAILCVISLSASVGNLIPMNYKEVTSTTKAGELLSSSTSGSTNGAANSKTWIIGTGNAGTMHSSQVKNVIAGSAEFGSKIFEDMFTTY